jgi:putative FmdB family regulatory protein
MPRYKYSCGSCGVEFIVLHSWEDSQEHCIECESDEIVKLVSRPLYKNKNAKEEAKAGDLTDEYIEANKEILEELKEDTKNGFYEPS